jgi:hypothetical protein
MPVEKRFDFHLHTRCSDGARAPGEVVELAVRAGLAGVSITDHDTADAYAEIGAAGSGELRVLPGIEVSAACEGVEVHILGYFPDGFPPGALEMAERLLAERGERMREGVERLLRRGMRLEWKDVLEEAPGRAVSRGHLAQALVKKGFVPNVCAAFPDVLGPETVKPPAADARGIVRELSRLGGIAVWAHPSPPLLDRFLAALVEAGLGGVELHTPRRSSGEKRQVESRIAGHGLFVSGGSDWHGHNRREPLGNFSVRASAVGGFLRAVGW